MEYNVGRQRGDAAGAAHIPGDRLRGVKETEKLLDGVLLGFARAGWRRWLFFVAFTSQAQEAMNGTSSSCVVCEILLGCVYYRFFFALTLRPAPTLIFPPPEFLAPVKIPGR